MIKINKKNLKISLIPHKSCLNKRDHNHQLINTFIHETTTSWLQYLKIDLKSNEQKNKKKKHKKRAFGLP